MNGLNRWIFKTLSYSLWVRISPACREAFAGIEGTRRMYN